MSLKLLKRKDFVLLILGKFVSMIGSNMQQFALALYVYALTESALIFSTMLSISILPRLLVSPVAGVFGDWFDRKKMIVMLDIINAVVLGVFAYLFYINGAFNLWMIYGLVIVLEITEIFYGSSSAGIIPSIVEKEEMTEARSLESFVLSMGILVGPMVAAFVYGAKGMLFVLIINGISFLISGLSEMWIHVPKKHKRPEKINISSFFVDIKEGLKVIKDNPFIRTIISLGTIVNFVVAPFFTVGFIVLIKEVLEASDYHFGVYQTVMAGSMITAPIIIGRLSKKFDVTKLCVTGFVVIGLLVLSIAVIPIPLFLNIFEGYFIPFILLMVITFGIGVSISVINISISSLFGQVVPLHLMGRTSTVLNLLVTIAIPLGQITFGFLFDMIHASYVIIICGLILLFAIAKYKNQLDSLKEVKEAHDKQSTEDFKGGELAYEI